MDRVKKLKQLEVVLKSAIDECETDKLAALAKQYRETLREIDEIEHLKGKDDGIAELLQRRQINGLPGAVRKNRS